MSSSPKKKGGFRWDDVRIFYDDLNTMMMEIMMMTKYDDDEKVGKRIRGRRNWPDSGAAGGAGEIRRRHRGAADLTKILHGAWRRRLAAIPVGY